MTDLWAARPSAIAGTPGWQPHVHPGTLKAQDGRRCLLQQLLVVSDLGLKRISHSVFGESRAQESLSSRCFPSSLEGDSSEELQNVVTQLTQPESISIGHPLQSFSRVTFFFNPENSTKKHGKITWQPLRDLNRGYSQTKDNEDIYLQS